MEEKTKAIFIHCESCGYTKRMVIKMSEPNASDLIALQENKACPNCVEHNTLHIKK